MLITELLDRDAELYPNKVAVAIVGGPTLTFSELRTRVRAFACHLASNGVRRGDRVAIMADNGLPFFDVYLATAYLGAAAVPINTHLTTSEIKYILDDSAPNLIVIDPDYAPKLQTLDTAELQVLTTGTSEYETALRIDRFHAADPVQDTDTALIVYTSGTTGRPKGVCLSQHAIVFNALISALAQEFKSSDVFLNILPMYHVATGTRVATMLLDGQTHVVLPKFDAASTLHAIEEYKVTLLNVVPTQLQRILDCEEIATADISSLRLITYGAAPSSRQLVRRARDVLSCGLYHGYGLTEAVTNLTALLPEEHRDPVSGDHLLLSCGRALTGVRVEIRNDEGEPRERNEVGEIWIASEKLMSGYWRNPEATSAALVDGWLRTGDLGYQDPLGYLFIVGRVSDMIISGGENIYPAEIEDVLHSHPDVIEAAVIGQPDAEWGESPIAYVMVKSDMLATLGDEDLRGFCRERLAKFKVPRSFILVPELPRTATGKVRKVELRAMAEHGHDREP